MSGEAYADLQTERLVRLVELVRRDHVPEDGIQSDMSGQDTFRYCGGCGVDLDEGDCEYLAILDCCVYEEQWTDEVGSVPVCVFHHQNSRYSSDVGPYRSCLAVDPW